MGTLFELDRPKRTDKAVQDKAIGELLKRVIQWLIEGGDHDAMMNDQEIRAQLDDSVHRLYSNGYEAARHLDQRYHWAVDAELVEILDGWFGCECSAYDEAIKAWVKECNIKPKLAIGTRIKFRHGHEELTGAIEKIILASGCYLVNPDVPIKYNGMPIVDYESAEEIKPLTPPAMDAPGRQPV